MSSENSNSGSAAEEIIIDAKAGLVFSDENGLYEHFEKEISLLENEFFAERKDTDIEEENLLNYESNLSLLLEDPDEVWEDYKTFPGKSVWIYQRSFGFRKDWERELFHVAVCYLTEDVPSFVYLHFPTFDKDLVKNFCRNERVYDRESFESPIGAIDGDALNEGDELALGLYKAMMLLRGESDFVEERFIEFHELREISIEEPDEIWRNTDSFGNTLVSFVKEFTEADGAEESIWYIVVTLEDTPSNSHALLFSFPTNDPNLVDRYRHGENLQAEEVVQESSH